MNHDPERILAHYDREKERYKHFAQALCSMIESLCKRKRIKHQPVQYRVKTRKSLENKIRKGEGKYKELTDVTDICGLRIITYFDDDVDRVDKEIAESFIIDQENSVDKRVLDPDRFGYLSLHKIVSLPENRAFQGLYAELQIRSILQHAWAEIEHDLGYKTPSAIPDVVRRRFSRIASLLEVADSEFRGVRDELKKYSGQIYKKIMRDPGSVSIDKESFKRFIAKDELVQQLDGEVSSKTGASLIEVTETRLESLVRQAEFLGFGVISDVQRSLREHRESLVDFAVKHIRLGGDQAVKRLQRGTGVIHLFQFLSYRKSGREGLERLYEIGDVARAQDRGDLAARVGSLIS